MGAEGVALAVFLAYFCPLISSSGGSGRLRDFSAITSFSKFRDQKYWFDTLFLVLMGHTY